MFFYGLPHGSVLRVRVYPAASLAQGANLALTAWFWSLISSLCKLE
jgi:hypothetical protein